MKLNELAQISNLKGYCSSRMPDLKTRHNGRIQSVQLGLNWCGTQTFAAVPGQEEFRRMGIAVKVLSTPALCFLLQHWPELKK